MIGLCYNCSHVFSRVSRVFAQVSCAFLRVFTRVSHVFTRVKDASKDESYYSKGGQWRSVSVLSTLQLGYRFCEKKAVDYKDYKTFVQA